MYKEFVSYKQAVALKELGFNDKCMAIYFIPTKELLIGKEVNAFTTEVRVYAPLKQQVFRWFREKYNYWSYVYPYIHDKTWHFHIQFYDSDMWGEVFLGNNFKTYEEAENACIDKLIELAKQQDK